MKTKRIAAIITALAVLMGTASAVLLRKNAEVYKETENSVNNVEEGNSSKYLGQAQSIWLKINELWRLSLNSELEEWVKTAVQKINSEFDADKLLLAAEKSEDDFEAVADEYLAALQLGLDFDKYTADREEYEKEKSDVDYSGEILTCEKIDEYLNQLNTETANEQVSAAVNTPVPSVEAPAADVPEAPNAKSVLPENPAEKIRNETEEITNRALGAN